jgi:hypothetical protein
MHGRERYADSRAYVAATTGTGIVPTNRWYGDAVAEAAVYARASRRVQLGCGFRAIVIAQIGAS